MLKNGYIFLKKVLTQNCETDIEHNIRKIIQAKLNCSLTINNKCNFIVLNELVEELNSIKLELQSEYFNVYLVN
jgi:hypothetical protein